MPNPNPKLIDLDFPSGTERHPSPIIPMPAAGPESGAASEVRVLVDQLQQAAWEARARLRSVEEERNSLATRLEEMQALQLDFRARLNESSTLAHQRDAALREAQLSARAANESHGRALAAEKLTQDLQRQCEEATRQREELRRSLDSATRLGQNQSSSGPDVTVQLFNLRQARDAAQEQNRLMAEKLAFMEEELATLREDLETAGAKTGESSEALAEHATANERNAPLEAELLELREASVSAYATLEGTQMEVAALQQQREEGLMQLEILSKEVMGLRQELQKREMDLAAIRQEGTGAEQRLAELTAAIETLRAEAASAKAEAEEARAALATAQEAIATMGREREEIAQTMNQQSAEAQQWRAELSRQELIAEREKTQLAERFEAQRLQTIDLATRFEAAQHEIRIMSADLAEARLLAKAASARAEEPREFFQAAPAVQNTTLGESSLTTGERLPPSFDAAQATEAIRAMRRCYQAFAKEQSDLSHLNELNCHIHALGESANASGLTALQRIVAAFGTFVQELYQVPEQINESSLLTIPQTIDFLGSLMKVKTLAQLKDSASSTVYVVEDDPLTCECITMVMESALMQGLCSQDPSEAACQLAVTPCDLIFLDIRMPGMDGFELCTSIRNMALHRDTPIVFLSGDPGPDTRAKCAQVGGSDFLPKPFILCELTLKALLHIAKAQLHMV